MPPSMWVQNGLAVKDLQITSTWISDLHLSLPYDLTRAGDTALVTYQPYQLFQIPQLTVQRKKYVKKSPKSPYTAVVTHL